MTPNTCGCRSCGGPGYRSDSLVAIRIAHHVPFILFRRQATAGVLANRYQPMDLFTRLVMGR